MKAATKRPRPVAPNDQTTVTRLSRLSETINEQARWQRQRLCVLERAFEAFAEVRFLSGSSPVLEQDFFEGVTRLLEDAGAALSQIDKANDDLFNLVKPLMKGRQGEPDKAPAPLRDVKGGAQ